jgi:excisionase family DNA binding protein
MSTIPDILTFDEAAAWLKCSVRTVERMAVAEVLEQRGKGRLRRITGRSVQRYIDGEVLWDGARMEKGASTRAHGARANGSRKSASLPGNSGGRVVLLDRLPKGRGRNG